MSTDRSGMRGDGVAEAVLRPRTTAELQEICRIATRFGVPIVPRGLASASQVGRSRARAALL